MRSFVGCLNSSALIIPLTCLVLGVLACSSPTAPDTSPHVPAAPVTPLPSATGDALEGLLSDPFLLELTSTLSDPAAGGTVREALNAALVALAGRNATTVRTALERVGAAIGTYRHNRVLGDDDLIVLEVIQNTIDLGRDWIVFGTAAVSLPPDSLPPDAPDGSPATQVSPSAAAPDGSPSTQREL